MGSFDSTYKLSEDTEMGLRLYEKGYRVLYHPELMPFMTTSLSSAQSDPAGASLWSGLFYMFGRHPRVMREWAMPSTLRPG